MSDYLNTLVARTLRLGPVVQPRLASLFEPVSAGPVNEQVSEVFETRSPRENYPPPLRVSGEQPDLSIPKSETRTESGASNEALNEPGGVVLQSQPVPAPLLPTPAMPPSLVVVNDTESIREVRSNQLSPRSADNDSITTPSETLNNPTPSRIKPEVRIIAPPNNREQRQSSSTTQPLAFAPPAPLPRSREVNAPASTPAEAPEAVVITIGRVDVRAVFAQPPPAAPRSNRVQQQAMSLDEYLKQRSEGRR